MEFRIGFHSWVLKQNRDVGVDFAASAAASAGWLGAETFGSVGSEDRVSVLQGSRGVGC